MTSKTVGIIAAVSVIGIFALSIVMMGIGYSNSEIELRNQAKAQQEANQAIYDEVWKVIKQHAQVTDKYAGDFKEIYTGLMSGRYDADSKSNPMFKWISEHNPSLSDQMYISLADTIKGQRAKFTRVQTRLIDIKREHDNLRLRFPSKLFVGGREPLEIQIVTSSKTKETFSTGEENDVEVF